jgi:hypothetical protein
MRHLAVCDACYCTLDPKDAAPAGAAEEPAPGEIGCGEILTVRIRLGADTDSQAAACTARTSRLRASASTHSAAASRYPYS